MKFWAVLTLTKCCKESRHSPGCIVNSWPSAVNTYGTSSSKKTGMILSHSKQRLVRAPGRTSTLFPILNRIDRNMQEASKFLLGHLDRLTSRNREQLFLRIDATILSVRH